MRLFKLATVGIFSLAFISTVNAAHLAETTELIGGVRQEAKTFTCSATAECLVIFNIANAVYTITYVSCSFYHTAPQSANVQLRTTQLLRYTAGQQNYFTGQFLEVGRPIGLGGNYTGYQFSKDILWAFPQSYRPAVRLVYDQPVTTSGTCTISGPSS